MKNKFTRLELKHFILNEMRDRELGGEFYFEIFKLLFSYIKNMTITKIGPDLYEIDDGNDGEEI